MSVDLDIYGVYLPGFFGTMFAAYVVMLVLRRLAARSGFYALVWHRALFDLAVYVLIVGALFSLNFKFI